MGTDCAPCLDDLADQQIELLVQLGRLLLTVGFVQVIEGNTASLGTLSFLDQDDLVRLDAQLFQNPDEVAGEALIPVLPTIDLHVLTVEVNLAAELIIDPLVQGCLGDTRQIHE